MPYYRKAFSGPVLAFDPQGLGGDVPRLRWAPQRGCADALVAIGRARALAGAQLAVGTTTNGDFWQQTTEAVLRCCLHAAALAGRSMREVLLWASRPTDPTPVRILRAESGAVPGWAEELSAQAAVDSRRSHIRTGRAVRGSEDAPGQPGSIWVEVLDDCDFEGAQPASRGAFMAGGALP